MHVPSRFALAALPLLLVACTGDIHGELEQGSSLELIQNDDTTVAGYYARGGTVIDFTSTSADQNQVDLHLEINGAVIDVSFDLAARTMNRDGHLNAFYRDELDAVLALRDALQTEYAESLAGTLQGIVLVRHLDHLAEAPVGHTFGAIKVDLSEVALEDRVEQVSSDKCGGNGVKCLPGTSGWRKAYYDKYNSGTCLADYRKYGNSWCAGRCGSGCPKNNWWELISDDDYTRDCFDHDWCTVHFGEDNGSGAKHCGDEYDEAVDDYAATVVDYCPE